MIAFVSVVAAIIVLSVLLLRTMIYGRAFARGNPVPLVNHKRHATWTLVATFLLIAAIETFSKLSTVHMTDSWLFKVHMCFAVPFLIALLLLRFWATGVARPTLHGRLAYVAMFCFIGVLATGLAMLYAMR